MYDPEFHLHLRNSDCYGSVVLCWPVIEFKTYPFERDAKSNSLQTVIKNIPSCLERSGTKGSFDRTEIEISSFA